MKTRTVTRYRWIEHSVNGQAEMVREPYDVQIPVPPRDWDRIVLATVTAVAGLVGAASIVWSTASIGGLLSQLVIAVAAFAAAAVFDLVWLSCMALEWLARYDAARARAPRLAGWFALGVAMAAVFAHGYLAGQPVIGAVGAVISGLAKGLWTIVLRHHAKPLDPLTQQWVDKRRARAGGQLAMVAVDRELARAEAAVDAERVALRTDPDAGPDESGQDDADPESPELPTSTGPMTMTDAVRTARDSGFTDPEQILAYVRTVADANAKLATVERYVRALRKEA